MMIEIFVDDSGTHQGSRFCVVAGYRGSERQWRDFYSRWTADGCKVELHATDFFRRDPRGKRVSAYRDWDDAKASEYLDCRLDAINCTNIFPVGAMINVAAFMGHNEAERRHLTGGEWRKEKWRISGAPKHSFFLPFQQVIIQGVEAVHRAGDKAHFYFDVNRQLSSFGRELYAQIKRGCGDTEFTSRMGDLTFASSSESPGLQAADLFAHCWYHYRLHGRSTRPEILRVMNTLTQKGDELDYFSSDVMKKLLGKIPPTNGRVFEV
jgi:hypothetical protein